MSNKEKDTMIDLEDITLDIPELPDFEELDDDLELDITLDEDDDEIDVSSSVGNPSKRGRKPRIIHANIDHGNSKELLSTILRTDAKDLLRFVEETEKENEFQKKIHADAVKKKIAEERAEKNRKKAERKNKNALIEDDDQNELDEDALDTSDAIVLEEELETIDKKNIIEDPSFHDEDLFSNKNLWKSLSDNELIKNNSYKKAMRPVFRIVKTFSLLEKHDIGEGKNPLERLFIMTPEINEQSRDSFQELVDEINENCDKEETIHNQVTFGGNFSLYEADIKIMITDEASYLYVKEHKAYLNNKTEYIYAFSGGRDYLAENIRQNNHFIHGDDLQHRIDEMIQDNNKAVETALFAIQNNNDNNQEIDLRDENDYVAYRNPIVQRLENITPCGINNGHIVININDCHHEVNTVSRNIIEQYPEYDHMLQNPKIGMRLIDNKLCTVLKTDNYEAIFKPLNGSLMTAKSVNIKVTAKNSNNNQFEYESVVSTDNLTPGNHSQNLYEKISALLHSFSYDISEYSDEKKEFLQRNIINKMNEMSINNQRENVVNNNIR